MLSNKFYTNKTDFWCSRPSEFAHFSVENWRKLSTPWKIGSNESDFDNCQIFNVNFSTISTRPEENTENIPCTSWEYDTELFDVSLNTYQLPGGTKWRNCRLAIYIMLSGLYSWENFH